MSFSWSEQESCYRAFLQVSIPNSAMVYRTKATMRYIDPKPPLVAGLEWFTDLHSANVIVVGVPGDYLLAGAVTAHRSMTFFHALTNCGIITSIEMVQPEIKPGETPEETVILTGADWRELLTQYADITAEKMGVKKVESSSNLTGYCSWYYYYKEVSQANLLENVEALAANRTPYAAEYVQIDDGFQTFQGDWLEQNDQWPTPLQEIAAKITAAGMKPGIWLMPTTASTASRVFREHPDWFVKKENGEPTLAYGWSPEPDNLWACLDATIPEAREHIANVFKTLRSWGFVYFKMDGLSYGLQRGIRRDPKATSVSAYRLLLKTIREAVPDAVLTGCGAPFMPSLGYVDNCRVSNDTSRYYVKPVPPSGSKGVTCDCCLLDALRISMSNFWCFDRWFRADPDVVMARQDNAFYTENQAKTSVLGAIMSGVAFTSDHLGLITGERNALLAKAQNLRMRNARPLFSCPNIWPREYEGTIDGKRAVALLNDSGTMEQSWNFADLQLTEKCLDLLTDKRFEKSITLEPGDAALLIAE